MYSSVRRFINDCIVLRKQLHEDVSMQHSLDDTKTVTQPPDQMSSAATTDVPPPQSQPSSLESKQQPEAVPQTSLDTSSITSKPSSTVTARAQRDLKRLGTSHYNQLSKEDKKALLTKLRTRYGLKRNATRKLIRSRIVSLVSQ